MLVKESASNHARSLKSRELSPKFSKKATGSGSRITLGLAFATSGPEDKSKSCQTLCHLEEHEHYEAHVAAPQEAVPQQGGEVAPARSVKIARVTRPAPALIAA